MPASDTDLIRPVTEAQLRRYGDRYDLSLTPDEVEDYLELVNGSLESFETILAAPAPTVPQLEVAHDRPAPRIPTDEADPLNAWIRRMRVAGADDGPLDDLAVGLKDSIALAGYPMTLGSEVLEGFVPSIDATVTRRLLAAGATIVGQQNMESFASSGSGDTSDYGPVLNPYSDEHLAGGSSSGSAAAVAAGDCEVSIGTDQAGSVRIPSACCGTVGLKPTTGLVPYTGAFPLDLAIDHLGPIGDSVETVARTLEVIAGEDVVDGIRLDSRQPRGIEADAYTAAIEDPLDDLAVGVLEEGFGWPFADEAVDAAVREAMDVFEAEGASVRSVSMERHRDLSAAGGVVAAMGSAATLEQSGLARGAHGWHWTGLANMLDALVEARADRLPPSVKQALLTAAHVREMRGMTPYAMARNLALEAQRRYDELLETCDVLAMPTIVIPPMAHEPDLDRVEAASREWMLAANTAPTDLTGHPAISVPCAMRDGLPVGLMLVGGRFEETTVLRAAAGFERTTDWQAR